MNRRASSLSRPRRSLFMALAGLALFLKILIPPGYMAAPPKADGPAFALMLCTAQGMVMVDPADLDAQGGPVPAEDDGARHSPCVFAGHGLNAPATSLILGEVVMFTPPAIHGLAAPAEVVPGRGLAAPPPPARGPPSQQA